MRPSTSTGRRLGRYHLVEPIGGGPTGEVFRAKVYGVAGFERQFAVKRFYPEVVANPTAAARLSAAARAYGSLEHPRIARLYEYGVATGETFTAVELVAGLDLARLVGATFGAGHPLPPGAALGLVSTAARAVGFAHGRGIHHLGLSPSNLISTPDGEVKVTDFGILPPRLPARPSDDATLSARLAYLAPEQLVGEGTSAATDVFALGVIAYELVTGERAFAGPTPIDIEQAILSSQPRDPGLPRPLVRVLQRCLARSPFERFPDARALADAIDAALRMAPVVGGKRDVATLVRDALARWEEMHEQQLSGMLNLSVPARPGSQAVPRPAHTGDTDEITLSRDPLEPPPKDPLPRAAAAETPPARAAAPVTPPRTSPSSSSGPVPRTTALGPAGAPSRPAATPPPGARATPPPRTTAQGPAGAPPPGIASRIEHSKPTVLPPRVTAPLTPPPIPPVSRGGTATPPPRPAGPPGLQSLSTATVPANPPPMPALRNPTHDDAAPTEPVWREDRALITEEAESYDQRMAALAEGSPASISLPADGAGRAETGIELAPATQQAAPVADAARPTLRVRAPQPRKMWALAGIAGAALLGAISFVVWNRASSDVRAAPTTQTAKAEESKAAPLKPAPTPGKGTEARRAPVGLPPGGPGGPAAAGARVEADAGVAAPLVPTPPKPTPPTPAEPPAVEPGVDALVINSNPPGARVFLDGAEQGKTPLNLPGSTDRHTMAMVLPGYDLIIREIEGRGNYEVGLSEVTPSEGRGGIKVRCKAKNRYYVFVDGQASGMLCPTERIGVELGEHSVEVYDLVSESRKQFPAQVEKVNRSLRVRVD